jgi:hypothetical protein
VALGPGGHEVDVYLSGAKRSDNKIEKKKSLIVIIFDLNLLIVLHVERIKRYFIGIK